MSVEHSGWKGTGGSSLYQRPLLRTFFRQYALRAAARRMLRVATLSFGTTPAAVEFSVEAGNRVWQMKIGYQEALAPVLPRPPADTGIDPLSLRERDGRI